MKAIKKFTIDTKELSSNEKVLLDILVSAAEVSAGIYLKQKNDEHPGANFYPSDATKEEIEKAAKKDPAILNPYTIVKRNDSGQLIAVPYAVEYKEELTQVADLLKKAAESSDDQNFKEYLLERAKDLFNTNYDKSNIAWLKTGDSKIGCVIGAFDRYLDKLFFKKRGFMSWIGVLDQKSTEDAKRFVSMTLATERKYLPGSQRTKIPEIRTRIENTAIFSGLVADFIFTGNNLPSSADIDLIKKHGTLLTVFNSSVQWRFENWIYPIFKNIFSESIQKKYSKEELYSAFLKNVIAHETCHSLMRYKDAAERLEEYFPFFDELHTDLLGIKAAGTILLKDGITQKELESFLLVYICRTLHWQAQARNDSHIVHYATGGAMALNFIVQGKTLKDRDGKFFVSDFGKLFICLDQLSYILDYYIALANHSEAKEFLAKYGTFDIFEKQFLPKLSDLENIKK
tara:strand:+ start:35 stop:1408 length:1374 start_codon:yes stop_codon:yes gene_type:complete